MNSIILAAAPNGAYKQKSDHPALPTADNEIFDFVCAADQMGISMVHLHIRDAQANHSLATTQYRNLLTRLKKKTKLVVQVTSEAAGIFDVDAQIKMISTLKPEFVSIALREILRAPLSEVLALFAFMRTHHIKPQLILYDLDDTKQYLALLQKGIGKKFPLLYVAGRYQPHDRNPDLSSVEPMIALSSSYAKSWMLCGFEKREPLALSLALKKQGHIRIGFENNLFSDDDSIAADNLSRLREVMQTFRAHKKIIASPERTRTLLTPEY